MRHRGVWWMANGTGARSSGECCYTSVSLDDIRLPPNTNNDDLVSNNFYIRLSEMFQRCHARKSGTIKEIP